MEQPRAHADPLARGGARPSRAGKTPRRAGLGQHFPPPFVLGVNMPWVNNGWDFGHPPRYRPSAGSPTAFWGPRRGWETTLGATLDSFRTLGFDVVRWFVLADALPIMRRPSGEILGLADGVAQDFYRLLAIFARRRMRLMPSLISFEAFAPAYSRPDRTADMDHYGAFGDFPSRVAHQNVFHGTVRDVSFDGFDDIVSDPANRRRFWQRVFHPLLVVSSQFPRRIYAWEIANEPDWVVRRGWMTSPDPMKQFLLEGVGHARRRGFATTVGFTQRGYLDCGWARDVTAAVTHPQIHFYGDHADDLTLMTVSQPNWIVGEFGSARTGGPFAHLSYPDKISHIRSHGFSGAFVWSLNAGDARSNWSEVSAAAPHPEFAEVEG